METYWHRVRYNNDDHQLPPWILKEVDKKGKIAIATRSFKSGDWICSEFPMVWVHGHHPFDPNQVDEIETKVLELCDEDRVAFYQMENVFKDEKNENGSTLACGNQSSSVKLNI